MDFQIPCFPCAVATLNWSLVSSSRHIGMYVDGENRSQVTSLYQNVPTIDKGDMWLRTVATLTVRQI